MTQSERGVLTRLPITHQPSESHPQFLGRPRQPVVRTDRRSRRCVRDGVLTHVVLHNPSVAVFRCRNVRFQSLPRIPHGDRTNRSGALDGPSLTRRANRSGKSRGPNTSRPLCDKRRSTLHHSKCSTSSAASASPPNDPQGSNAVATRTRKEALIAPPHPGNIAGSRISSCHTGVAAP